jgi:prepilin-type N-terminal cleavage/methylation domain-containing protein
MKSTLNYSNVTPLRLRASVVKPGFTLIEVLITLLVLAIGLTGTLAIVMGSTRNGNKASDRNIAAIVLDEAIADIQRNHLITVPANSTFPVASTSYGATNVQVNELGLYIETIDTDTTGNHLWPNLQYAPSGTAGNYTGVKANNFLLSSFANPKLFPNPNDPNPASPTLPSNVLLWPASSDPKYYGGPLKGPGVSTGVAYRVAYKLERSPNWIAAAPNQFSFDGVYVLTLTVYKDLNPAVLPGSPKKQLEQISDPMVVYLHARGRTD